MSWRYAMWHRLLETQIAHQTFKRQTTACAWFGDCECSENSHKCEELFVFPNVQGPRVQVHKWWLENGSSSWLRTGRKGRLTSIPFRKEQLQICSSFISSLSQHSIDTKVTLSITMTILSWDNFHPKHQTQQTWIILLLPNLLISSQTNNCMNNKNTSRSSRLYRRFRTLLGSRPPPLSPLPKSARIPVACKAIWISPLENADAFFRENVFWSICSECICVYII